MFRKYLNRFMRSINLIKRNETSDVNKVMMKKIIFV